MDLDNSRMGRSDSAEYFWGGELTGDAPELVWDMKSDINEDEDDDDFAIHTLFLKLATLGKSAVSNEQNIVQVESVNFSNTVVKQPLLNMVTGVNNTVPIDMSFAGKLKTVFRLIEGSGPVYLSGQHLVELPKEDYSQDESLYDDISGIPEELDEDDDEEDESDDESTSKGKGKSKKRRNSSSPNVKVSKAKQKSKMEAREESESDEEEDDDEDDEDMDVSVMKKKKGKAGGTLEGQTKKDKKGSIAGTTSVKINKKPKKPAVKK